MADNTPITSVNSELISAGLNPNNPSQTYVDFANQLAKNSQEQQLQEQAIARAKELTSQAQLQTRQGAEAEEAGANPLLVDTMTPEEAKAYLNIILKEKGLSIDDASIDEWVKTLPDRVNRQIVEAFASRFAKETTRSGQPAMFQTTDKIAIPKGSTAEDLGLIEDSEDPSFGHVPEDGMYQVIYDNQGLIKKFIPGGKEPIDQSAKLSLKAGESAEKQWQKLDAAVNQFLKSTRGNQLSTAIIRSNRALNELASSDVLTPQVLSFIQKDLSGIFQGGVPPQAGMEGEDFTTTMQKVNGLISKYTGVQGFLHTDLGNQREYLLGLLSRLRESSVGMMKAMIASEAAGYQGIISADPDRWAKMTADKVTGATAGLSATAENAVADRAMSTGVEKIPGIKSTAPKLTLPSVSDIDAELARRK